MFTVFQTVFILFFTTTFHSYKRKSDKFVQISHSYNTRPVSTVRNASECRSWGRRFDPSLVPYFVEIDHGIISTVILLLSLIQEGLLSVTSESMCTKYWLTVKRAQEKVWLGELTTST